MQPNRNWFGEFITSGFKVREIFALSMKNANNRTSRRALWLTTHSRIIERSRERKFHQRTINRINWFRSDLLLFALLPIVTFPAIVGVLVLQLQLLPEIRPTWALLLLLLVKLTLTGTERGLHNKNHRAHPSLLEKSKFSEFVCKLTSTVSNTTTVCVWNRT